MARVNLSLLQSKNLNRATPVCDTMRQFIIPIYFFDNDSDTNHVFLGCHETHLIIMGFAWVESRRSDSFLRAACAWSMLTALVWTANFLLLWNVRARGLRGAPQKEVHGRDREECACILSRLEEGSRDQEFLLVNVVNFSLKLT